MKGAREYAGLFTTGQYGRLFIRSDSHARGKTFYIWVLEEGYDVENGNYPNQNRSVEVYGVVSGQRGWTESYGWLKKGPWIDDFNELVKEKKAEISRINEERKIAVQEHFDNEAKRKTSILESY